MRDGYDRISYEYRDDAGRGGSEDHAGERAPRLAYEDWLAELPPRLQDGDPVLDLGCGCGVPATAILAERYDVTGVDLSQVQVERARRLVPRARLLCADMSTIEFPAQSFAAVVSFLAIIHVPVEEQPAILKKIYRWLRPRGYFLATLGARAWTGTEDNWHGAPMYWSHADRNTYLRWLDDCGFRVLWDRFISEATSGHTLLLAQTPTLPSPRGEGD